MPERIELPADVAVENMRDAAPSVVIGELGHLGAWENALRGEGEPVEVAPA